MIHVTSYQPFQSRVGKDTVIRLNFPYDLTLVALLKRTLTDHRAQAVDPAKMIMQPGGWRPQEKCWFVERAIWPQVKTVLIDHGYQIQETL